MQTEGNAAVDHQQAAGAPTDVDARSGSTLRWAVGTATVTSALGLVVGALLLSGTVASARVAEVVMPPLPAPDAEVLRTAKAVLASTTSAGGPSSAGAEVAAATTTTAAPSTAVAVPTTVAPAPTTTTAPLAPGSPAVANPWLAPSMPLPDPATAPVLGWGDSGPLVSVLQTRLAELGYRPGTDGSFDYPTWSAVLAFQKSEVLERTEEVDAATWARLAKPLAWRVTPSNRFPRVEVDIERQVAIVVLGRDHVVTLNTSTGNGEVYRNEWGGWDVAETPVGIYEVYGIYDEVVTAPLGQLYRPVYFIGGYAIHGSGYVPSYPDSHGCVRLANGDMDWVFDEVAHYGMPVAVYATMNPSVLPTQPFAA